MLQIQNIRAGYNKLQVLKNVSLHIRPGEIVTLIGANGSGKSTLLKTIMGLIPLTQGNIQFEGINIGNLPTEKIVKLGIAMVPEGRQIFGPLTVRDNLILGAYSRFKQSNRRTIKEDLAKIYELFPCLWERNKHLAGTLSGGEQQMLAIGRALMSRPKLLLLDEPSTGLAPLTVETIFERIQYLRKQEGTTICLVEQNVDMALEISDRGYVLETGKIVYQGMREDLLGNAEIIRAYLG